MSRLFLFVLSISVGSCAGAAVIAVLVMERYNWPSILGAAVVGGLIGMPVAWYVTRRIRAHDPRRSR